MRDTKSVRKSHTQHDLETSEGRIFYLVLLQLINLLRTGSIFIDYILGFIQDRLNCAKYTQD